MVAPGMPMLQEYFVLSTLLVAIGLIPTTILSSERTDPQTHAEIAALVEQLGNAKFAAREEAAAKLDSLGSKALPLLREASDSHRDLEIRHRASQLVEAIELRTVEVQTFPSHKGSIYRVAFTSNDRQFLSTGYDPYPRRVGSMRLWDTSSRKEVREHLGLRIIYDLTLASDGKRAATGAEGGDLRIWDLQTGEALARLPAKSDVMAVAWVPGTNLLLSATNDSRSSHVQLWDVESQREIRAFTGFPARVYKIACTPDGLKAVTGGVGGSLVVWDIATGRELLQLKGHTDAVGSVVISADSRQALSSSADRTMRLWDLQTGKELKKFLGHSATVRAARYTPDGKGVITAAEDGTVRIWNRDTGKQVRSFPWNGARISDVATSSDGKIILAGDMRGMLRMWKLTE